MALKQRFWILSSSFDCLLFNWLWYTFEEYSKIDLVIAQKMSFNLSLFIEGKAQNFHAIPGGYILILVVF